MAFICRMDAQAVSRYGMKPYWKACPYLRDSSDVERTASLHWAISSQFSWLPQAENEHSSDKMQKCSVGVRGIYRLYGGKQWTSCRPDRQDMLESLRINILAWSPRECVGSSNHLQYLSSLIFYFRVIITPLLRVQSELKSKEQGQMKCAVTNCDESLPLAYLECHINQRQWDSHSDIKKKKCNLRFEES